MGRERALRPPTAADGPNSISLVTAAVVEAGEGFLLDCLNVKSEERVVYKELNSTGTLIQKTTMEAPHETLCITSDWMFTRRRSATA